MAQVEGDAEIGGDVDGEERDSAERKQPDVAAPAESEGGHDAQNEKVFEIQLPE